MARLHGVAEYQGVTGAIATLVDRCCVGTAIERDP